MISKIFRSQVLSKKTTGLINTAVRGFANSEPAKETPKTNLDGVVTTDKAAKDAQYEEMAFKFEREWKKIYDERNDRQMKALSEELSETQRNRVEVIAQALLELNVFELRYFSTIIRDKIWKTTGVNPMKINVDWPALKQLEDGTWPPANPNWFMQQEAIAKLWPSGQQGFAQLFGGAAFGSGGGAVGGAAPQQQAAAPEKKEEVKEEKKVEKTNFDVELSAIDAAQKIKIIKEVRAITNLGLKEAKEMVEKAPVTLKKGVKKDEAEKIKELLATVGCTVNLL